jgi:hypothetical protein
VCFEYALALGKGLSLPAKIKYNEFKEYTVTIPQKLLFCFLLSVFLCAGIAALAFTGIFDYGGIVNKSVEILTLVAVFLMLFLILFFCFNVRRDSAGKIQTLAGTDEKIPVTSEHLPETPPSNSPGYEEPEKLEAAKKQPQPEAMPVSPPEVVDIKLIFDDDDIPYLVESGGFELVDEDIRGALPAGDARFTKNAEPAEMEEFKVVSPFLSALPPRSSGGGSSGEAAQLEAVTGLSSGFSLFWRPFTFAPGNPELLQGAGNQEAGISGEVVYERNGIHYINSGAFARDANFEKELNGDFVKLVESVVKKT